jgi:hypothetical protein
MLQSETSEIVFFEGGFIEKVIQLDDSINVLIKKYMPLLKNQLSPAEEVEGGKRRKSRKNKRNNRTKTSKKRFKSRKRYYKTKGSLLYKLFL